MDDDSGDGFGPTFWIMLILGIVGVLGFLAVSAGAMGGAL